MKAINVTLVGCILCFALLVSASGVIAKSSQSSNENDRSAELMEAQNLTEEGQIGGSSSGVAIQGQILDVMIRGKAVKARIVPSLFYKREDQSKPKESSVVSDKVLSSIA